MGRREALQGVRMANIPNRWESAELNQAEAAASLGASEGAAQGAHRRKRERRPLPGMMLHQDGSRHQWLEGQALDLVATLDDATGAIYSAFLVSRQARGRSERAFQTPQDRLVKELRLAGITPAAWRAAL